MHTTQRLRARPSAVMLAILGLPAFVSLAQAQSADATTRIEITGSIIKRFTEEGALPVTSVRSEDLQLRGHTELRDFMLELPQANSLGSFAGTAGPVTSLRGFGPMRTLTLLNGRRMAKEPLTNQYVSVNVMPRMAMTRVDILRDGASSAYGSDAISGVQAFYTHRSFTGLTLKAEGLVPTRDGGGDEGSIGALAGVGNLARDGWNGLLRFYEAEVWRLRNRAGDEQRAAQGYAIAVAYPDAPADAWRWHGLALVKQGHQAEGRRALARYLQMKPGAPDAPFIRQMIGA